MTGTHGRVCIWVMVLSCCVTIAAWGQSSSSQVGREVAIPVHLQDGDGFTTPVAQLIQFGVAMRQRMRSEPPSQAWEASVLPLNYARP